MSKIQPFCVFCRKRKEPLVSFTEKTGQKCTFVLEIRQRNNLSLKSAKVPLELNDVEKYHSKCYRQFTALPPKYRKPATESSSTSTASSSEKDAQTSEKCAEDGNINLDVSANPSEQSDENQDISHASSSSADQSVGLNIPTIEEAHEAEGEQEVSNAQDAEDSTKHVCVFCNKQRKKYQGREQQLQTCTTDRSIDNLNSTMSKVGDVHVLDRISEQYSKSKVVFYHKLCRLNCQNALTSQIAAQREKTEWHKSREIHKQAFQEVCRFVLENIVNKRQCYFLSYLKSLYIECAKDENIDSSANVEPYNLEQRLTGKFPKKIAIVSMNNKKVVKPYTGILVKNDLNTLEKQNILDKAVLILRSEIRDIKRNPLPDKLTTEDLIRGECDNPNVLLDFYSKLIRSTSRRKRNPNVDRVAKSFSEDLIYAVSNGQIKPSKHINLGLALKSLTNSKKIISIVNKYGHCCSYPVLEELETEATFRSTLRTDICPEDISRSKSLSTGSAYNNFDRFVDTPTGKDTLHDTADIIFQDIVDTVQHDSTSDPPENLENITENIGNIETALDAGGSESSSKRRRTFDAITFELEPYTKKPKLRETLEPVEMTELVHIE